MSDAAADADSVNASARRFGKAELVIVALALATAASWVASLLSAFQPPLPVVTAYADGAVVAGAPWPVRIVAAAPGSASSGGLPRKLDVEGRVTLGGATVDIARGIARVERAQPGPASFDVVVGGHHMRGVVDVAALESAPGAVLQWSPWTSEVVMHTNAGDASARSAASRPVYPIDGRVSARLRSPVLVIEGGKHRRSIDVEPQVQGALLDDGRVLAVDRSGFRIELTNAAPVDGNVTFTLRAAEPMRLWCDLVVDGAVRDAADIDAAPDTAGPVALRAGDVGDAVGVVHCSEPWPEARGRTGITRIIGASTAPSSEGAWLRRHVDVPAGDPLMALLDAEEQRAAVGMADGHVSHSIMLAARARMVPSKVRAPKLAVAWAVADGAPPMRIAFAVFAALLLVCALALGLARLPDRRAAVVVAVVALGAVLAGLGAALFVVGAD